MEYEPETARVLSKIPAGHKVVIIGSSSFWGQESEEICWQVGAKFANISGLALITGGVAGVGEAVGRSFHASCSQAGEPSNVFHLLPAGSEAWDYGTTLFAGSNMMERREVLGRLARTYVAIEGGPGTLHEASIASQHGAIVIPVGRAGGISAELHNSTVWPEASQSRNWELIASAHASVERVAAAVCELTVWAIKRGA